MQVNQILLSIILVVRDCENDLEGFLRRAIYIANSCAEDHEIILIDNGSTDGTVERLRNLCREGEIPNVQAYVLSRREDHDIAAWAGLENALGDYLVIIDPTADDIGFLPQLLEAAIEGVDLVFALNTQPRQQSVIYNAARSIFATAAKRFLEIDSQREMPFFRVLSRRVVNFMLRQDGLGFSYRWLPAASGFRRATLNYASETDRESRNLINDISKGVRILISSTSAPMRLVTLLSFFGAVMNLIYSCYIIVIALVKDDVAPGWVTLSLQQSGMFFLFSVVLLIIGEYLLHTVRISSNAPSYYFAEEFASSVNNRRQRLNVDVNVLDENKLLKAASLGAGKP